METHLDKKFYVPSIEEFYIGFEFEHKDPCYDGREEFQKAVVESDNLVRYPDEDGMFNYWEAEHLLSNILYDIKENNIRVKYLDQSDIEELGFTYKGKTIDIWFEKEGNFDMGTWTSYKCQLHYGIHDNRLFIDMIDMGDIVRVFNGIIKNKSELKKVLQMLNIK